jgi:hypothetical protein
LYIKYSTINDTNGKRLSMSRERTRHAGCTGDAFETGE